MKYILLALMVVACTTAPPPDLTQRPIRVTTTVGMITDTVRNIGGERVKVTGLMGPGVDPHLYKPSYSDVRKLDEADIIFYGGLDLEGRMTELFEKIARNGKPTYPVSEDIDSALLRQPIEFEGKYDPHLWFDVTLWKSVAQTINKQLAELDPDSRDYYQKNTVAYLTQLDALHQYVKRQIASLPPNARVVITAHDAFGYFGDQYGLEVIGLQGTSTATEAGAADVRDLAEIIAERKIKALFIESSVPQTTIEAVQAAVHARGWDVQIGGQLFSDALGQEGTPEGTYVGMVKYNVDTIVAALK